MDVLAAGNRSHPLAPHLKDLEAGDVQDAQEGRGLPLALIQRLVDPSQDPPEQTLVHRLGQRLDGKVSLGGGGGVNRGYLMLQCIDEGGEELANAFSSLTWYWIPLLLGPSI